MAKIPFCYLYAEETDNTADNTTSGDYPTWQIKNNTEFNIDNSVYTYAKARYCGVNDDYYNPIFEERVNDYGGYICDTRPGYTPQCSDCPHGTTKKGLNDWCCIKGETDSQCVDSTDRRTIIDKKRQIKVCNNFEIGKCKNNDEKCKVFYTPSTNSIVNNIPSGPEEIKTPGQGTGRVFDDTGDIKSDIQKITSGIQVDRQTNLNPCHNIFSNKMPTFNDGGKGYAFCAVPSTLGHDEKKQNNGTCFVANEKAGPTAIQYKVKQDDEYAYLKSKGLKVDQLKPDYGVVKCDCYTSPQNSAGSPDNNGIYDTPGTIPCN